MGLNMTGRTRMKAVILLLGIWLLTGCVAVIVGAGVGVGTYTFVKGGLIRSYQAEFNKVLQICTDILKDLDQPILDQTTDGEKTTIRTKRKDGTDQTIEVSIVNIDTTQVTVRTGVVGYWKRDISRQFHEFIAERLKR